MTAITRASTIGQLVIQKPGRSRVFESLGIDYCCGGGNTLEQACARKGLRSEDVIARLNRHDADPAGAQVPDPVGMSLTDLAEHIETTHHAMLRTELPRLAAAATRVAEVHGVKDARLVELRDVLAAFRREIESHMFKEERILFPMIRQIDRAERMPRLHCGSIENPIRVMEMEHDAAGAALEHMKSLTDNYHPPTQACNTWRALLDGLALLATDMHLHVHKENNILFPRAAARLRSLADRPLPMPM